MGRFTLDNRRKKQLAEWWGPQNFAEWKDEVLASIVVCFAQIPESVAFAALANVPPAVGLHAAWIVGGICALWGGRPGMINGSAGALASVTCNFVVAAPKPNPHHLQPVGIEELFVSVVGAGIIITIAAAMNVGKFLCLVPATVMIGFCNGLAIVIGKAQMSWFQDPDGNYAEGNVLIYTIAHCALALVIMISLPKITKQLPASLICIIAGCIMEYALFRGVLDTPTWTIEDKSKFSKDRAVPRLFFWDSIYDLNNISNWSNIGTQSVTLAVVAMLESLMTLEVMNDMTGTQGQPNRQVWALGIANTLAGLFGTMGGNSLIELSVMNVQAGGVLRCSTVIVAGGVLAIVLFASPLLNYIPAGTLAGIMVIVVMDTAKWSSLPAMLASILPHSVLDDGADEAEQSGKCCHRFQAWLRGLRIQKYDSFIILVVTVMTAITNLAYAVFAGVFLASVRFAWMAQQPLEISTEDTEPDRVRTYKLKGNLFFAAKERLASAFTPDKDPPIVEIDFGRATVYDFSVLHALHPVMERYTQLGTEVKILNMKDATHIHNLLRFTNVKDGGHRSHCDSAATASLLGGFPRRDRLESNTESTGECRAVNRAGHEAPPS